MNTDDYAAFTKAFYHGFGVDGEWMGFETTGLGFYPDRICVIRG